MARGVAHVYVHEAKVQSFLLPGQPVDEMTYKVSRDTKAIAQLVTGPRRSGRMVNSIQANRPSRTGPYQNMARVFVKVGYGFFVHEGTAGNGAGYIYPKNGKYLAIPRVPGGSVSGGTLRSAWKKGRRKGSKAAKPYFTAVRIHGQQANPFLAEALHMAMPK